MNIAPGIYFSEADCTDQSVEWFHCDVLLPMFLPVHIKEKTESETPVFL